MPSDSMVIAQGQMPGELVRTAEVQVIRVDPERWVAPHPGLAVRRAKDAERELALYEDTMERKLAIGLGRDREPVHIDLDFLDGTKGGHVSISGISGVATKTSTALALIRLLLAHPAMRRRVRVLLFNVKGEDLLFLDHPNRRYAEMDDRRALDERWARLGLSDPGGFPDVAFWAPPRRDDHSLPSSESRHEGVKVFGWTPHAFVLEGLLRFCFADASDMRSQLSFVEERVRGELLRRAVPVLDHPGAVGLLNGPAEGPPRSRPPRPAGELMAGPFHDLDGLVAWLVAELEDEDGAGAVDRPRRERDGQRLRAPPRERGRAPARPHPLGRVAHPARRRGRGRAAGRGRPPGAPARLRPAIRGRHAALPDLRGQGGRPARPDRVRRARRAQQVRAAGGRLADQGHAHRHRPARALARGDPHRRPAAGVAGGARGDPERGHPHRGTPGRRRGRAQRVRLARDRRPRPRAAADAGPGAGEPAERAGADRGGGAVPAVGDDVGRGVARRAGPGRGSTSSGEAPPHRRLAPRQAALRRRARRRGPGRARRDRRAGRRGARWTRSSSRATCSTGAWSTRRRSAPASARSSAWPPSRRWWRWPATTTTPTSGTTSRRTWRSAASTWPAACARWPRRW